MVLADIYITVHPKAIHIAFGLCVLDTQLCVFNSSSAQVDGTKTNVSVPPGSKSIK